MPRYNDGWVVDRTMFDYISGGACACCGMSHLFLPDGLQGLVNSVSDLETDDARDAAKQERSPFPNDMNLQLWTDRVRLRFKMKKEMSKFREWTADLKLPSESELLGFCRQNVEMVRSVLQLPRSEVSELIRQYGIHGPYAVLLCAVTDQVAYFEMTKYPTDGRGMAEEKFEKFLTFNRRRGFTLPLMDEEVANEDVLNALVKRMLSLGGPKLLDRKAPPRRAPPDGEDDGDGNEEDGPRRRANDDDDDDDADDDDQAQGVSPSKPSQPSFRSDRRMIRLLIARYWTRRIMEKYQSITGVGASDRKEESTE